MENMEMIKVFENGEFGQVRTAINGNKVLFCANDVARALGYASPPNAISSHCKGATVLMTPSAGGSQPTKYIPESDVYRLVFSSKMPNAERFTDWVTEDVLPSIRQTGGYIANQDNMTDDELVAAALLVAQRRIEQRDARINDLEMEKKALVGDILHWEDSAVLNAIVRRLASRYNGDFASAWKAFFKELYYKHSISLEARKTAWQNNHPLQKSKAVYKYLEPDEIDKAVSTAVALCAEVNLDVADILNNYQK